MAEEGKIERLNKESSDMKSYFFIEPEAQIVEWPAMDSTISIEEPTSLEVVQRSYHITHRRVISPALGEAYQKLSPNMTVKIPSEIVEKLKWSPSTELWIETLDEDLRQIIIGEKLHGKEAERALSKLEEMVNERS